jgi:hypothetical protein
LGAVALGLLYQCGAVGDPDVRIVDEDVASRGER